MARFEHLDSRFDPYASTSNLDRSQAIRSREFPTFNSSIARRTGLSIIVLNLNRPELIESLWTGFERLTEIFRTRQLNVELLLGDTGSTDPKTIWLLNNPPKYVRIFRHLTYNFSRCNNALVNHVAYDSVLFLNNDVLIEDNPQSIKIAYETLVSSCYSVVSTVLEFADGSVQHAGVDFFKSPELFGFCFHPQARTSWVHEVGHMWEVGAITGAFLMMRTEEFERLGGFDEVYLAECQDVDLCLKARRAGRQIGMVDSGPLVHLENATRPTGEENWHDRQIFIRRWNSLVEML